MSHYGHYRGRSIGRVLHFLHFYCPHYIADQVTIGEKHIMYSGYTLATYTWSNMFGEVDVPTFDFHYGIPGVDHKVLAEAQTLRRKEAIRDSIIRVPNFKDKHVVDSRTVRALKPVAWHSVNIWSGIFKETVSFFIANLDGVDGLFFKTSQETYEWTNDGWVLIERIK